MDDAGPFNKKHPQLIPWKGIRQYLAGNAVLKVLECFSDAAAVRLEEAHTLLSDLKRQLDGLSCPSLLRAVDPKAAPNTITNGTVPLHWAKTDRYRLQ